MQTAEREHAPDERPECDVAADTRSWHPSPKMLTVLSVIVAMLVVVAIIRLLIKTMVWMFLVSVAIALVWPLPQDTGITTLGFILWTRLFPG